MKVIEPATEKVLAEVAEASVEDADRAVARAKAAYPAWRAVSPGDRAKLLRRFANSVADEAGKLAKESIRTGRSIRQLARGRGVNERQLNKVLDLGKMTKPGLEGPGGGG